jgi:ribosomal protein S18 acetylase RimI-like enzyme
MPQGVTSFGARVIVRACQKIDVVAAGSDVQVLDMIDIRKAEAKDIPEVAGVFIASQADALPYVAKLHTPEETFRFIADNVFVTCEVWVATEGGRIIGMMAINRSHIDHLYLQPGFYRRGIGTRLLNHAKRCRPMGLTLYAFQENVRACTFYMNHGFRELERGDGSDNEARRPDILFEWKPEVSH